MTNALAYDGVELITAVKSFILQVQVNSNEDEVNFFETVVGRRPSVVGLRRRRRQPHYEDCARTYCLRPIP